jgi:hypothetical protein
VVRYLDRPVPTIQQTYGNCGDGSPGWYDSIKTIEPQVIVNPYDKYVPRVPKQEPPGSNDPGDFFLFAVG